MCYIFKLINLDISRCNKVTPVQNVSREQRVVTMGGTFGYAVHLHFETRIGIVLDMGTTDSLTIPGIHYFHILLLNRIEFI